LGFAQAEDRLWQMVFNVKVANGELSEVRITKNFYIKKYKKANWRFWFGYGYICKSSKF